MNEYEKMSAEAAGDSNDSVALASIAISLKRLADQVDKSSFGPTEPFDHSVNVFRKRTDDAVEIILKHFDIDGAHHKAWVIDQVARCLLADEYDEVIENQKFGENGPDTYKWNEGIAP